MRTDCAGWVDYAGRATLTVAPGNQPWHNFTIIVSLHVRLHDAELHAYQRHAISLTSQDAFVSDSVRAYLNRQLKNNGRTGLIIEHLQPHKHTYAHLHSGGFAFQCSTHCLSDHGLITGVWTASRLSW